MDGVSISLGARVVLGSATPALETLAAGRAGTLRVFALPQRIGARPLPPVEIVDLRTAPRVPEARAVPWSEVLDDAVRAALAAREQVILLLNRRGFARFVQCPACGDVPHCDRCAITTTDQETGARDPKQDPIRTLKTYRYDRVLRGVTFGQNCVVESGVGERLAVGAALTIEK